MNVTIEDGDIDGGVIEDACPYSGLADAGSGGLTVGKVSGGVQNAVIKVDLSAYPNATVTLAQFQVYVITGSPSKVITAKKLLRDWGEGDKIYTAAADGDVTWNNARHNEVGGEWTLAGGRSDGNDRSATIEWQGHLDVGGADFPLPLSVASVQADIDNPASNYGFQWDDTASTASAVQWGSSEGANKPVFYMEYTEDIEPSGGIPRSRIINFGGV